MAKQNHIVPNLTLRDPAAPVAMSCTTTRTYSAFARSNDSDVSMPFCK
jgi:hypothetical protein